MRLRQNAFTPILLHGYAVIVPPRKRLIENAAAGLVDSPI